MNKGLTVEKVEVALEEANGSVAEAARILDVSRVTVYEWIRRGRIVRVIKPRHIEDITA